MTATVLAMIGILCAWRALGAAGNDQLEYVLLTVAFLMAAATARAARRARP